MAKFSIFTVVFMRFVSENVGLVSNIGYHTEIGVPKANSIKLYEESVTKHSESAERIVQGSVVAEGQVPFQAGILINLISGWTSMCGGSLVSNTRVITAAHCWFDGRNQARLFTIVLGSGYLFSGGTRVDTSDIEVHPMWNPDFMTYDIAIIRIDTVEFNNNIFTIPLPSVSGGNDDISGLTAVTSGYGKTSDAQSTPHTSATLHQVELILINNSECQLFIPSLHVSLVCGINPVGGGVCDGDDGGPLTTVIHTRRTLVGITSHQLGGACEHGFPSIFTRVSPFLPWINSHL